MLHDKVSTAKKIDSFLKNIIASGAFKLKYRITVNPSVPPGQESVTPDISVELAGPDSTLLLERGAEVLRSLEVLTHETLHLQGSQHFRAAFQQQEIGRAHV